MKRKKLINAVEKISDYADIPRNIATGGIEVKISRNNRIKLEGYVEIIKYSATIICLKNKEFIITISGENLDIAYLAADGIAINGKIDKLEYLEI
ncbi:MAG: YabP/YqfC family sporulation protein [Oscillospiraceae bacterium]